MVAWSTRSKGTLDYELQYLCTYILLRHEVTRITWMNREIIVGNTWGRQDKYVFCVLYFWNCQKMSIFTLYVHICYWESRALCPKQWPWLKRLPVWCRCSWRDHAMLWPLDRLYHFFGGFRWNNGCSLSIKCYVRSRSTSTTPPASDSFVNQTLWPDVPWRLNCHAILSENLDDTFVLRFDALLK